MDVVLVFGKRVAELDENELRKMVESRQTVRDLKRRLSAQVRCSRFQQRLMISGEAVELEDDMTLRPLPSVQLVILPFCAHDETIEDELIQYCRENRVGDVERLLQRPQHPSGRGLIVAVVERPLRSCPIVAGGWTCSNDKSGSRFVIRLVYCSRGRPLGSCAIVARGWSRQRWSDQKWGNNLVHCSPGRPLGNCAIVA